MTRKPSSPPATARVVPPPVLFGLALVIGLGAQWAWPWPLPRPGLVRAAGALLALAGLAISTWVTLCFSRAATPVSPLRPSRHLVVDGPYRFSRNPDYLGQALLYTGIALLFDAGWVLAGLVPAWLLVQLAVVPREERYLQASFGEAFERYCRRVRRWL